MGAPSCHGPPRGHQKFANRDSTAIDQPSGLIFVLCSEALILLSRPHAEWAATFLLANLIYIPLLEEPMMVARFGDDYREYCRHVGRIVPRLRAWQSSRS